MENVLDISLDSIGDVQLKAKHMPHRAVNKDDHYLVDDYGVTVLITSEPLEAAKVYTEIRDSRQKAMIHVVHGIQSVVESNAPLMYNMRKEDNITRHEVRP